MASASMICGNCKEEADWETFCIQCEQMYCTNCSKYHRGVKATRKHILVDVSHRDTDLTNSDIDSDCGNEFCEESAIGLCIDCEQVLCDNCISKHYQLKATKDHTVIAAKILEPSGDVQSRRERDYSLSHGSQGNISHAQVPVRKGIYEGTNTNDFAASAPGEKEIASIRGIAIMSVGKTWQIVVADYKNRNLKLYNSALQFLTSLSLKDEPRGMVAILNDEVAVTFADKSEIRIYKIETGIFDSKKLQLKKTRAIKINKPFSIACNKEHFAVESGEGSDGAIKIFHVSGKGGHFEIPGKTRWFGQFTGNTIRLELDFSHDTLYVVDIVNSAVHSLNFKNITLNWTVKLGTPRGIVLHEKTLFIASVGDNKIYQLSATDGMVWSFLDDQQSVKIPRYIAYNPEFQVLASDIDLSNVRIYKIYCSKTEVTEVTI